MNPQEKDFLQYTGNKVPRVIRLAWTLIVVFSIIYLAVNALPDLLIWIQKIR